MERQKKRRRDADCPIVTYRVGLRTFERLLKEDSLEETKEAIRQKLKVEDGVQVQLAQLRGGMTIDLEDEDDFDAFHTAAHKTSGATVKVTVIRANGVPASHVSIRPTDSISNAAATSSRSVRFSSPEDEPPPTGGKRKASAIEPASDGESASIPRRHRPVKKRRDEAPEPHQPEEPAQEDEEAEPAPVVVKKKRGRPPKVKPLEGAQTIAGTSASAGAPASAAEPAPEASAPDAMDTAPDSVQPAPLPEKKKRGRPRKDSMSASAQPASAASQVAAQSASTGAAQVSQPAVNGDAPPVPVKRKPGRPRKHPLPEEAAAAAQHQATAAVPQHQLAEVVIEQPSATRGRSASRRPTDPDNDVGDANAAQEEASKKKRTRSRSRSRAADDAKASKLKAVLAEDDTARDDTAHIASASAHVELDAETPSTSKRGRKKKVVPPSGEDADNEDASPEVETVPKERKKKKRVAQEAVDVPEEAPVAPNGDDEQEGGETISVKKARKKRKKKQEATAADESGYRTGEADRTGELSEAEIDEGRKAARARFLSMLEQHTAQKTTAGQIWGKEKERKKKQRRKVGQEVVEGAGEKQEEQRKEAEGKEEKGKEPVVHKQAEVAGTEGEDEAGHREERDVAVAPTKRKSKKKKAPAAAQHGDDADVPSSSVAASMGDASTPPRTSSDAMDFAPLDESVVPTDWEAMIQGPERTFSIADIPSDDEEEEPERMELDPEDEEEDERWDRRKRQTQRKYSWKGLRRREEESSSDEDRASPIAIDEIEDDDEHDAPANEDRPSADADDDPIVDEAHPEAAPQNVYRPPQVQRRASGQHHSFASIDGAASSPELDRAADIAYNKAFDDEHPSDVDGAAGAAPPADDGHETDLDALTLGYPSDTMSDAGQLLDPHTDDAVRDTHDTHANAMDEDPIEAPPPTQSAPPSPIESILPDLHSPFQSTPRARVADRMRGRNGRVQNLMPSPIAEAILATSGAPDARGVPAMKGLLLPPWSQPERDTRQSSRLSARREAGLNGHTPDASEVPPAASLPTPSGVPPVRPSGLTSSSQPVDDTQPSLTQWTTLPNVPPSPSTLPEDSMADNNDQLHSSPGTSTLSPQLRRKSGQYDPPQLPATVPDQDGQSSQAGDDAPGGEEEAKPPPEAGAVDDSDEDDSERAVRESVQVPSRAPSQSQPWRTLSAIASASPFASAPKRTDFPKKVETPATQERSMYGSLAQDSDSSDGDDDEDDGQARQTPSHIPKERQAGRKATEKGVPT